MKIKNKKAKPYKAKNREDNLNGPINKVTKVIKNKKRLNKPPMGD